MRIEDVLKANGGEIRYQVDDTEFKIVKTDGVLRDLGYWDGRWRKASSPEPYLIQAVVSATEAHVRARYQSLIDAAMVAVDADWNGIDGAISRLGTALSELSDMVPTSESGSTTEEEPIAVSGEDGLTDVSDLDRKAFEKEWAWVSGNFKDASFFDFEEGWNAALNYIRGGDQKGDGGNKKS